MTAVQAGVRALEQGRFEVQALTAFCRLIWVSRNLLFVGCELDLETSDCTSMAESSRYFLSGDPSTVGSVGTVLSLLARF